MAEELVSVSPKVLEWARTSLGLNVSDVAVELDKDVEVIEAWERGDAAPTYAQLEKLAYTLYKRPLAIFFLDEPPNEPDVDAEFRSFLSFDSNRLEKDTHLAIRDAKAKQLYLSEFSDSQLDHVALNWLSTSLASGTQLSKIATDFRDRIGVSEEKIRSTASTDLSLAVWREAIENLGIFVFKRAFKQSSLSGFCISHARFPLIVLNNKTSFTRQTFTLIHELAHLALNVSGICAIDTTYVTRLNRVDRKTEEQCDRFAAEVLVPTDSFLSLFSPPLVTLKLEALAKRFRVSPAVIARKALDTNFIDREQYSDLMRIYFPDNWRDRKKTVNEESSGNYYNTQLQYLSKRYVGEAFRKYSSGTLSAPTLADYLGIKVASIGTFENMVLARG